MSRPGQMHPAPPRGLSISADDARAGRVAQLHAQDATDHGSVFLSTVPGDWLAGPCVVVVGHDALTAATGEARGALSSAEGSVQLLGTRFGRAVINADEPQHTQDRRRWAGAFAPAAVERSAAKLWRLITERAERWAAQSTFDVFPAMRELSFAAIATCLGGFDDDAKLARAQSLFADILEPTRIDESDLQRHVRASPLRDELEALLAAHVSSLLRLTDPEFDIVTHLRRQEPALDEKSLIEHLDVMLVVGHETSASVMTWLLHYASIPRWREWLREELGALPATADLTTAEAIDALPRLQAFVRETGRLHPALIAAPRVSTRAVDIAGVRIPARSRVALSYAASNVLPSAYRAPQSFDPQRWFDAATPAAMTFGSGYRLCIGMRFASLEFKIVLAYLLTKFNLVRGEDSSLVNAGFWNARPAGEFRLSLKPL